jgi:hypothetical protein
MPVRISRLAAIAAVLALGSLAACEVNTPAPAPVVVNPQPQAQTPVVVQQPAPPPASVVVNPQ